MNHPIVYTDNMIKRVFPKRPAECNKSDFGYIALIGGSLMYSGAIRLAAMADSAVRSGAGVCTVAAPASICPLILPQILEATLYPLSEKKGTLVFKKEELAKLVKRYDVIAFGMGAGLNEETVKIVRYLLAEYSGILIVDADGINAMASMEKAEIAAHRGRLILTPHLKEFSRVSGVSMENVSADPAVSAERLANELNAVVLLKGSTTFVSDGNDTYSVTCGSPGMASGGSGDVLSGIVAAVMGNRFSQDISLCEKTAASALINGRAGEIAASKFGEVSMGASDTARCVAEYLIRILD